LRAQSPFYRFIDHPLARGRIAQFNEEQKAELERRLAKVEQALADLKDEDDWI
jgi:predicted ribosome quality control (RQC) complex YloA/Tae2 family protein